MDVQEAARRMTAAPSCESFAPSSEELRDEPWSKWSSELLRGRRWSASVVPSAGGEELFDGYTAGRCVVNTWTKEEPPGLAVSQCLQRCEQEEGCLGVIYGQVEGPRRVELRCFLAGVGEDDVLMEYSCSSPGCVSRVSSRALLELSQTLQCWQKRWQRCEDPGEPPVEEDRESEERLASILSELRSKLKSLPAMSSTARGVFRLHFRHVLVILGGVCRLLGRAADQADATVQRCLHAAQATLEGPTGGGAWILLVPIGLGLLGQHLRSCFVQRWEKLQELKAAEKVSYADLVFPDCHDFVTSGPHPVPMLVSSGLMPESPDSPQVCEMLELPPARGRTEARRRAMTPPRPRSLLPVFKARHEDDHSSDPEQEVPPHVSHWRELEKIKKEIEHLHAKAQSPRQGARAASERALLRLLNHQDFEVVRRIRCLGDRSAEQIMDFRQRQGDLQSVRELASRVGVLGI